MILAIDDQVAVLEAISDILQLIDKDVILAEDGATARTQFTNNIADIKLILLDLSLPDEPGETLLAYFTDMAPDIPVIIMTGFAIASLRNRADLQTAKDFLEKPFRLETLLELVKANSPA